MENIFLKEEINKLIESNISFAEFLLRSKLNSETKQIIANFLKFKKKLEIKFPSIYKNILFINSKSFEQASSEAAAKFKASLISGEKGIDITGGLGIDTIFFSYRFQKFFYCEKNAEIFENFKRNLANFNITNIETLNLDGISFLQNCRDNEFDFIYVDPSRRNNNDKIYELRKCEPDIIYNINLMLSKGSLVLAKISPMEHYKAIINIFEDKLQEIISVSVNGENKEKLCLLSKSIKKEQKKTAAVLNKHGEIKIIISDFLKMPSANKFDCKANQISNYLYEFDPAIRELDLQLKASKMFNIYPIDNYGRYFTSAKIVENFPGRIFQIKEILPAKIKVIKENLKRLGIKKLEIITKYSKFDAYKIFSHLNIKQGGDDFLIFAEICSKEKICIICSRIPT